MKGNFFIDNDILSSVNFDLDEAINISIGHLLHNMNHGLTWFARRPSSYMIDATEYIFTDKPLSKVILSLYKNDGWEINETL